MDKIAVKRVLVVLLLVAAAVIFRLTYRYPHHPDHYAWGTYSYAVLENGYAPWVLHPTSLFGYYPLSVPSGIEFFSAYLSLMTGLGLPDIFFYLSIFSALYCGLALFVMMRKWTDTETSLLSAVILITLAFFMKDTADTASNRILNIIFYPLFIFFLFRLYECWKDRRRVSAKYIIVLLDLFVLMSIIHRLSQLLVIFLLAFAGAMVMLNWKAILGLYTRSRFYKIREKHYLHSKMYIFVDALVLFSLYAGILFIRSLAPLIGFLAFTVSYYGMMSFSRFKNREEIFIDTLFYVFFLVAAKAVDLALRSRLLVHVGKYLPGITMPLLIVFLFVLVIITVVMYMVFYTYYHRFVRQGARIFEASVHKTYEFAEKNPEKAISFGLFGAFMLLAYATFTGRSFITIDPTPYYSSFILNGRSSIVVFLNWLLNINDNLTILIWFGFLGIIYLFFRPVKSFYDYFFIFVALGFCQFIFDWEYIRLYLNPIYAIFTALGLVFGLRILLRSKRFSKFAFPLLALLLILHFVAAGFFMQREYFLPKLGVGKAAVDIPEPELIAAGDFLRSPEVFSIFSSSQIVRSNRVAYYAGEMDAVEAQSIFVYPNKYNITQIKFSEILDDITHGQKVRSTYMLKDWILGGYYYHGKHIYHYQINDLPQSITKKIIDDYRLKYIIDSPIAVERDTSFSKVSEMNDLIYSTPYVQIYDLSRGK